MAETGHKKSRMNARAWWSLAALGSVAAAVVFKALLPSRQLATQPGSPGTTTDSRDSSAPDEPKNNLTTDFEPSDWSLRPVALVYLAIPVLLVVSCLVLILAYPNALPDVDRTLRIAPPGPRLQTDTQGDLQKFRADEERRLDTYYWVDKQKGLVHIPIEQAMKKLAASGAPGFPKGQGQQ
jgi:hypothetical protein